MLALFNPSTASPARPAPVARGPRRRARRRHRRQGSGPGHRGLLGVRRDRSRRAAARARDRPRHRRRPGDRLLRPRDRARRAARGLRRHARHRGLAGDRGQPGDVDRALDDVRAAGGRCADGRRRRRARLRPRALPPRRRACSRSAPAAASWPAPSATGYDVVAVDPAADGAPASSPSRCSRRPGAAASFDAAVAVVSLHHVDPLAESCARLAELVRPGGVLVIDEFDVGAFDERAARWQMAQRTAAGLTTPSTTPRLGRGLRHHMHPVAEIRAALAARVRPRRTGAAARTSTAGTSTPRCAPSRSGSSPRAPCPRRARAWSGCGA